MDAVHRDLIKHAVRLSKAYGDLLVDPLRCRVAISRDTRCRRIPDPHKATLAKLIKDHLTQRFPLPARGGKYSVAEWDRIRHQWLRESPVVTTLNHRIRYWAQTLKKELGDDRFTSLFVKAFSGGTTKPESQLDSLLGTAFYHFGEVPKDERTYEALQDKYATFSAWCEKLDRQITLLSDTSLYLSDNPGQALEKLKDTEARYHLEAILTQCYGISFGSIHDPEVPNLHDVLDGRASLDEVVQAQLTKEAQFQDRRHRWRQACHQAILLANKCLYGRTSHLPSLNRRLKSEDPHVQVKRNKSDHYGFRYEVYFEKGHYGGRWDQEPELAFKALKTELAYLTASITKAHIEDDDKFYEVMRQAETTPIEKTRIDVFQLEAPRP